ncbi:MAG: hypothetical protein COB02_06015 [Candidatus Cloacimonadota bacterium]|nr:MAG: hypothetical protein COB02_12075 [Candidatus Cloacimonadota bacterium]PCJ20154.1 MAG: hypothetical protein COB02_06015 [Candidatus Cloacimonadota bacterium]
MVSFQNGAKNREEELLINKNKLNPYNLLSSRSNNKICVFMLHGFGVTPQIFGDLQFKLSILNIDSYAPMLTGKSWSLFSFANSSHQEWINKSTEVYDRLSLEYDEVIVLGFSMGGTLATHLSQIRKVKKVILLSPYFGLYKMPPFIENVLITLFKKRNLYIKNKSLDCSKVIKQEEIFTYGYTPLKAVVELFLLKEKVVSLPKSFASILIMHSRLDHVADYQESYDYFKEVEEFEFVSLEKSYHYILNDIEQEEVYLKVIDFIRH